MATVLALRDIRTIHARAEEQAAQAGFREGFDFVTSRAVADLRMLCELCLPYVKVGGRMPVSYTHLDVYKRQVVLYILVGGDLVPWGLVSPLVPLTLSRAEEMCIRDRERSGSPAGKTPGRIRNSFCP